MDTSLSVDAYNEEAFVEYRDKLRDGLQFLSVSANPQVAQNFAFALNNFRTEMALLIGDIQRWPSDRRIEAWRVMGPEIKQLTDLFEQERGRIVGSERYSSSFRTTLSQVPLLKPEMI